MPISHPIDRLNAVTRQLIAAHATHRELTHQLRVQCAKCDDLRRQLADAALQAAKARAAVDAAAAAYTSDPDDN
jgi:ABC-type transporter Mla subunit MlaD